MSSALLSFLPTAAIQERVPERVMPKAVSAASVVTARNKVRYTPISGQTYSSAGQNIITFRITDAASWLDLATAAIHLRLALPNPTPATSAPLCLDDFVHSIFDRIRVSVNGVLVEDVTDVNVKATAEAYASATFDFYRSAHGEQAGAWKWNTELGGTQVPAPGPVGSIGATPLGCIAQNNTAIQSRAWQMANSFFNPATASFADSQGHSFVVPLSFLTGLAKMGQQFPLRLVGNLELVLFLATAGACEYNGGKAAISGGSFATAQDYTITDVTLEVDTLTLAPMVVAAYDKLAAADSSEGGVVLPVDVITTNRVTYSGATAVKSLQVSRGTTQLLSLHVVKRDSSILTNVANASLSTFLPLGATSQQTQIGAVFYPAMKDDSQARMFQTSAKAQGKFASQFSAGLVSRDRYESDVPAAGIAGTAAPSGGLINQHQYAISYEQEAQENIDLQGISTLASGSVIQVNIEDAPSSAAGVSNPVANVFIRSRRQIQLANQSVQVIGN